MDIDSLTVVFHEMKSLVYNPCIVFISTSEPRKAVVERTMYLVASAASEGLRESDKIK